MLESSESLDSLKSLASNSSQDKPNWLAANVFNPAFNELVAEPVNILHDAVSQVSASNQLARMAERPVPEATPGSAELFTQAAVGGLCSAAVYVAAGRLAGAVLKTEGAVSQVAGAAALDFARTPNNGQTRLGNMAGTAATFSIYGLLNPRLAGLSTLPRLLAQAQVGALSAVATQAGMAKLSGQEISLDSLTAAATSGAILNTILPGTQRLAGRAIDHANIKLDLGVPVQRRLDYVGLSHQSTALDSLASHNARIQIHQNDTGSFEDHRQGSISLSISSADKVTYGQELGHALAHFESARTGQQEALFQQASRALSQGHEETAWKSFQQARSNEEVNAIAIGEKVRQQLQSSNGTGKDGWQGAPPATSITVTDVSSQLIPARGITYGELWKEEFDQRFVPSKGTYRPHFNFSGSGASQFTLQRGWRKAGDVPTTRGDLPFHDDEVDGSQPGNSGGSLSSGPPPEDLSAVPIPAPPPPQSEDFPPPAPDRQPNSNKAGSAFALNIAEQIRKRQMSSAFATVTGKLAEDSSGYPVPGDDEWNIKDLMLRRFRCPDLGACRQSREKQAAVLILDTSPSVSKQAGLYKNLAGLASKYGDLEMYDAPNGDIERRWSSKTDSWENISQVPQFRNRNILFFGDFDGSTQVMNWAHEKNKVFWFSPLNEQYSPDTVGDFRRSGGRYWQVSDDRDFVSVARKIR